jgi:hypothetical protein
MTTTSTSPSAASAVPVAGDRLRQVAVALSLVLALAAAALGSGGLAGRPVTEVAGGVLDTDATLVAPAGPAFAIWGLIYTGLIVLAVFQLLPSRAADPRQRAAGWWIAASGLLNAAWIGAVQGELLWVSVALIAGLLAVLVIALRRLDTPRASMHAERVIVDGTLGVYLGWVCIATVANTAAALVWSGMAPTGGAATALAMAVLIVAAVVGVVLAFAMRRTAPGLALAWGLVWVGVERLTATPESLLVGATALVAAAVSAGCSLAVAVRRGPSV